MEIQWAGEDHSWKLAPTVVPAFRPTVLLIQGHVPVIDLVAGHNQRPLDWLLALQPRHRVASLPPQRLGAKLMTQARKHGAPTHPSNTQSCDGGLPSINANAAWPIHVIGQLLKRRDGRSSQ